MSSIDRDRDIYNLLLNISIPHISKDAVELYKSLGGNNPIILALYDEHINSANEYGDEYDDADDTTLYDDIALIDTYVTLGEYAFYKGSIASVKLHTKYKELGGHIEICELSFVDLQELAANDIILQHALAAVGVYAYNFEYRELGDTELYSFPMSEKKYIKVATNFDGNRLVPNVEHIIMNDELRAADI
jgi:hypothetical protein